MRNRLGGGSSWKRVLSSSSLCADPLEDAAALRRRGGGPSADELCGVSSSFSVGSVACGCLSRMRCRRGSLSRPGVPLKWMRLVARHTASFTDPSTSLECVEASCGRTKTKGAPTSCGDAPLTDFLMGPSMAEICGL